MAPTYVELLMEWPSEFLNALEHPLWATSVPPWRKMVSGRKDITVHKNPLHGGCGEVLIPP